MDWKRCVNLELPGISVYTFLRAICVENMKFLRIGNVRYFTGLVPSFHTMGIYMQLLAAFSSSEPVILFTPKDPEPPIIPNAHNILEVAKMTGCRALGSVPSFLEVRSSRVNCAIHCMC